MTANEMYLDTVKTESNLKRLLQLIGVSMKGPTSSKATGKLTLAAGTTVPGGGVTIKNENRSLDIVNQRNSTPLTYTIFNQQSNGRLDLWSTDVNIPQSDFSDNTTQNLFLLEGSLQSQAGSFTAGVSRQTITIKNGPVIEGSIGVSSTESGGTEYNEISNLFVASGGADPVFEKTYTDGFGAVLTFGDGVRGRLPSPGANFVVTYRRGGGVNGNIVRNNINQDINCVIGSTTVQANLTNITQGTGGTPAESVEHAKRYAPYFFRTQYRAVTGEDYNTLANTFVGNAGQTAKAMAVLRKNGAAANVIDLYVLAKATENQLERASVAFKKELLDYFQNYKMLTDEIVVSDGVVRTLDIVATLYIDKSKRAFADSIKQKAANKLVEYFSVDNVDFGEKISLADVTNTMLTVPEIRFFNIDNLEKDIYVNFNEIVQLNNFEFTVELV